MFRFDPAIARSSNNPHALRSTMARRPFGQLGNLLGDNDPPAPTAGPQTSSAAAPPPLAVSQLAECIDRAIKAGLPATFRVVGEVSNFTVRNHWYFKIKDEAAVIDGIMWASRTAKASFIPANGQQVIVTGRVEYFKPRGTLGLYIEKIEAAGKGSLEEQLQQLITELRALGWLDPERKRPLPTFCRKVAVITSRTGAAIADVRSTMQRRCPAVDLLLFDTLVQGPQAADAVAAAVNWVSRNAARLGIDAVLVTRGGGSIEDLWAFNERIVAEAIVRCAVPVVAAIGHETDTTLAELVADERASTPTQAAMRLTPDRDALLEQVELSASRLSGSLDRQLATWSTSTAQQAKRLVPVMRTLLGDLAVRIAKQTAIIERAKPAQLLAQRRTALEQSSTRLHGAMQSHLRAHETAASQRADSLLRSADHRATTARETLTSFDRQLELVGPLSVLRRGFTITFDSSGKAITTVAAATPWSTIETMVTDGRIKSQVQGGTNQGGSAQISGPRRPRKARADDNSTGNLFG